MQKTGGWEGRHGREDNAGITMLKLIPSLDWERD